jgi:predicted Rossmann fold nucleotide-binding protein DprA/Smf involved in DNA uptake
MSLTDLKKGNAGKVKKKTFTVDEFISDAENYAKGSPELVKRGSEDTPKSLDLKQAISFAEKQVSEKEKSKQSSKPFRHATFTLSEDAITQLNELAKDSKLAKSHIIRILIDSIASKDQKAQLVELLNTNVQ